ncbi:MAG: pyridoxamine 5'-phosphate oxidase family protein [Clostridia bacterium]|nr:pyridoxamine 5'-phosphate oxidase family protein [Clostridia bacterium]
MFRKMRRFKQEISKDECIEILKSQKRAVLSVIGDDGYPYSVPINFYYNPDDGKIYFHSAMSGHKIDAIKACDKVCFTTYTDGVQKEDWSYHVKSVIVFGRAFEVEDQEFVKETAKKFAMKYYPKNEEKEVDEDIAKNMPRMKFIGIEIEHMTGKRVHEK